MSCFIPCGVLISRRDKGGPVAKRGRTVASLLGCLEARGRGMSGRRRRLRWGLRIPYRPLRISDGLGRVIRSLSRSASWVISVRCWRSSSACRSPCWTPPIRRERRRSWAPVGHGCLRTCRRPIVSVPWGGPLSSLMARLAEERRVTAPPDAAMSETVASGDVAAVLDPHGIFGSGNADETGGAGEDESPAAAVVVGTP